MPRPSARDIIDGIVQAMHAGHEPLDEDLILVPSVFDVMLHPNVYQELRTLLPRIRTQAEKRLDEELQRLNSRRLRRRPGRRGERFARLYRALRRLLFVERRGRQMPARAATYERAGAAWRLDFLVTAEPDAGIDYLVVETDFGTAAEPGLQGSPTLAVRRRTMRLPDGRFETVITARRPGGRAATQPAPATDVATDVLARLIYEDRQGRHVYYMRKPQIIIGRRDDPAHYLDVALDTLSDVSREHARIRHDPGTGAFAIKNVSRFGATIDGSPVAPSLDASDADTHAWHPLPSRAEIGLAGIVFIQFEAL